MGLHYNRRHAEPLTPRRSGARGRACPDAPPLRRDCATLAAMPNPPPPDDPARRAALYAQLAERVQEHPPELALPLYVADRCCGWATQAACDALRGVAQIELRPDALRIGSGLQAGEPLDALLAEVARTLREADCLRGVRAE